MTGTRAGITLAAHIATLEALLQADFGESCVAAHIISKRASSVVPFVVASIRSIGKIQWGSVWSGKQGNAVPIGCLDGPVYPFPSECMNSTDIDADFDVDLADFAAFQNAFGG